MLDRSRAGANGNTPLKITEWREKLNCRRLVLSVQTNSSLWNMAQCCSLGYITKCGMMHSGEGVYSPRETLSGASFAHIIRQGEGGWAIIDVRTQWMAMGGFVMPNNLALTLQAHYSIRFIRLARFTYLYLYNNNFRPIKEYFIQCAFKGHVK